jgi:hypothetical protein
VGGKLGLESIEGTVQGAQAHDIGVGGRAFLQLAIEEREKEGGREGGREGRGEGGVVSEG